MKQFLKSLPGVKALITSNRYYRFRHLLARHFEHRGHYTLTRFLRLPGQYDTLVDVVVPDVINSCVGELRIMSLACSNGAEPVSIASTLISAFPDLAFRVDGFDIDDNMLDIARTGIYKTEILQENGHLPQDFVEETFEETGAGYVVRDAIRNRLTFSKVDLLDPQQLGKIGRCDILFVQNLFNNLPPHVSVKAFPLLTRLLRPGGYLFVDGMDLGQKVRLTAKAGFIPVTENLETNYELARTYVMSWPWHYSGLEPLDMSRRDRQRRYATIFKSPDRR